MKKLCPIALLSVSLFLTGVVTPLSAGILDLINDGFGIDGVNNVIAGKHGTRVSWSVDNAPARGVITKDDIRVSEGLKGQLNLLITKDDIRVEY